VENENNSKITKRGSIIEGFWKEDKQNGAGRSCRWDGNGVV